MSMNDQLTNTKADGTAPFVITSTTKVSNLNVDRVDDKHISAAVGVSGALSITADAYMLHATAGTAITIAHLTTAGNIHLPAAGASNQILKNSGTAGTGAWGTVTENAGALAAVTTLSMNDQLTNTKADGTAPFVITSTTKVSNLNVDRVDDKHISAALGVSGALSITADAYMLHATAGTAITIAHAHDSREYPSSGRRCIQPNLKEQRNSRHWRLGDSN